MRESNLGGKPLKAKKVSSAEGFGVLVDGPRPYLAYFFSQDYQEAKLYCHKAYHKVVPVRMVRRKVKK